jgi:hypothetical protein
MKLLFSIIIVAFVLGIGISSCSKENAQLPTTAKTETNAPLTTKNSLRAIETSENKSQVPTADFVIKVVGSTQPVTLYLSEPGKPTRTISSAAVSGVQMVQFGFGNFFNRIQRNVTYTLSPVPVNWPGHQIRFKLNSAYSFNDCLLGSPYFDYRLWYIGTTNRMFLYASPVIANATIQFL